MINGLKLAKKPTLDPGCLEAIAMAKRAAGPRAVVPLSDNLSTRGKYDVIIMSYMTKTFYTNGCFFSDPSTCLCK